ncbi:6014_t:CDS:1, partial [Acaulospora colombiana]
MSNPSRRKVSKESSHEKYEKENESIEKSNRVADDSKSSRDVSYLLSSSVTGASSLVLLQLVSRMATFTLHQVVLRFTDPATFGIASVQLELLLATILFLSREGFRCALLRGGEDETLIGGADEPASSSTEKVVPLNTSRGSVQKITNISWIPIPIGMFTTFLACAFYIFYATEEALATPYYVTSVVLYGLSAFGELMVEPLYIAAMNKLIFKLRVGCEGGGVIVRCVITLALTLLGASDGEKGKNAYGILAFAVAQVAYTLVLTTGYIGYFLSNWDRSLLIPRKLQDE